MHFAPDVLQWMLAQSYFFALKSPDKSNQAGAVILDSFNRPLSEGWNHFPNGFELPDTELALDGLNQHSVDERKKRKYSRIAHAEFSAVIKAGCNLHGTTMAAFWACCADPCAKSIVLSGIEHLVVHKQRLDLTPERWRASVAEGLDLCHAAGVHVHFYDGPVSGRPVIVNGRLWSPEQLRFVDN